MKQVALRTTMLLIAALLLPACGSDSSSGGGINSADPVPGSVNVDSWPSSLVPNGTTVTITWTLTNMDGVGHNNIHWGTASGSHPNKSLIGSQTGVPNQYSDTITVPAVGSGTIFFVVHSIVASVPNGPLGQAVTSSEFAFLYGP